MKLPNGMTKRSGIITAVVIGILVVTAGIGFWLNVKHVQAPTGSDGGTTQDSQPAKDVTAGETVDITELNKSTNEVKETTLDVENWKEFKDPSQKYMIQFPQSWKISFHQSSISPDKTDIKLTGPEGVIDILWADSYGGACEPGYEKMTIKSGEVDVCHIQRYQDQEYKGAEYWQIQKNFSPNSNQGIYLNAFATNKKPEVIKKIIETLNIAS